MASKLESFRRHADAQSDDEVYLHHLSVSFQEGTRFNSIDPLERAIEAIELLLQRVNVDTGYILFHPYKLRLQYQARLASLSPDFDGRWPDTRTMIEREDWATVREARLVYDPHFHVFAVSDFVRTEEHTRDLERETGVVIHRITRSWPTGKSYSIGGVEDLCRIVLNELMHVGVTPAGDDATQAMLRRFGEVANFPADDRTSAVVTATLRNVAQSILGVDFSERRCTRHVTNGTQSCPDTTAEGTDVFRLLRQQSATSYDDSQRRELCGGKLISMHQRRHIWMIRMSLHESKPGMVSKDSPHFGLPLLSGLISMEFTKTNRPVLMGRDTPAKGHRLVATALSRPDPFTPPDGFHSGFRVLFCYYFVRYIPRNGQRFVLSPGF